MGFFTDIDEYGNCLRGRYEDDVDTDGTIDQRIIGEQEHDENGVLNKQSESTYQTDNSGDGVVDEINVDTYTYNDSGMIIHQISTNQTDSDYDGNFDYFSTYTYEYDENTGSLFAMHWEIDSDGDGIIDNSGSEYY